MSRDKRTVTGDADGLVLLADYRNNPDTNYLSCEVFGMRFFESDGVTPLDPATGKLKFEYSSCDFWRPFDISSQRNVINDSHQTHLVIGSIIRRVRVFFTDFPLGTKFECQLYAQSQPVPIVDSQVYGGNNAINVQPFTEANSKNGTQYEVAFRTALPAAQDPIDNTSAAYIAIEVGAQPVLIKSVRIEFVSLEISTTLFRSPTYTGGTELTAYNLNDELAVPDDVVIKALAPTDVTNEGIQVTPDFHSLGNEVSGNRLLAAESLVSGVERVLWRNAIYMYKIHNLDTVNPCEISGFATWYQGELSIEL
jgi:hypothetical protein